jgi:hypothetical protein
MVPFHTLCGSDSGQLPGYIVQIQAAVQPQTHILRNFRRLSSNMIKVNRFTEGIDNDPAVFAAFQVPFKFRAKLLAHRAIDIF